MKKSSLILCFIIMSESGRIWTTSEDWGDKEGNDMFDAMVFKKRKYADKHILKINQPATVFEIGLYNGNPVMLIDAYAYWLDVKYN